MTTNAHDVGRTWAAEVCRDEESEAETSRSEVTENYQPDVYRSHGASSRDAGRWVVERSETERFWTKVDRSDPQGCWPWLGQLTTWGYGHFRRTLRPGQYRTVKAHRLAYELVVGPIPRA